MAKEVMEVKIQKLESSIENLKNQKDKYSSKVSVIEEKLELAQKKLKELKSGALIETCEQKELSVKDIQVLSKGIADGSVLEYLGIKKNTSKENKDEKQN